MDVTGRILITGGTSGLGLELVKNFLTRNFFVVTTGRRNIELPDHKERLKLFLVDFADLSQTSAIFKNISKLYDFDYVIYNAGILSPPCFVSTNDGFEYTYQINFLAHFLMNEIILQKNSSNKDLRIAAVTSLAYRSAIPDLDPVRDRSHYKPWKAYSDSKYFIALMCRYYSVKLNGSKTTFFSFDPGIFGSGIHRMQSGFFKGLYRFASPILKKPSSSAKALSDILDGSDIVNGAVYDVRKRIRSLKEPDPSVNEAFWRKAYKEISSFVK